MTYQSEQSNHLLTCFLNLDTWSSKSDLVFFSCLATSSFSISTFCTALLWSPCEPVHNNSLVPKFSFKRHKHAYKQINELPTATLWPHQYIHHRLSQASAPPVTPQVAHHELTHEQLVGLRCPGVQCRLQHLSPLLRVSQSLLQLLMLVLAHAAVQLVLESL